MAIIHTYKISPYLRNEKIFSKYIAKYNIALFRGDPNGCGDNYGWSSYGFIGLTHFDNEDIELIAFYHELSHIILGQKMQKAGNKVHLCTLSNEGAAWEMAFNLAAADGFQFDYYHPTRQWAREQLKTYLGAKTNSSIELFGEHHA
jgi:hypothetical protein